jgi:LacI family transcriptional regulator
VSIATVSRVFNESPRVSEKTRIRVLEVARALHYQPHVSARSLANKRSDLVLAVIPMLTNYFYMEVVRGVQDSLADSDLDLLVYTAQAPEQVDGQLKRAMQRGRAEGILLFSTPLNESRARRIKQGGQPVVLVDSQHPAFDSISIDNKSGAEAATEHLISNGRKRIGLITGNQASIPARVRRAGYEAALQKAGLAVDPSIILVSEATHQHGYTEKVGFASMNRLLHMSEPVDAVFVASDIQALGVLRALREAGRQVPGDIAVVGFDDIQISAYVGLSTLRQPMYEMGRKAIELLLRRIEDPTLPIEHLEFEPTLIVRETSGHRASLPDQA